MSEKSYNEAVATMAASLKKKMTLGANGVVELEKSAVADTLEGTGLTIAQFKQVADHRDLLVASQGLALGEIGLEAMKKDKALEMVTLSSKLVKDKITSTFTRTKQVPDGSGGRKDKPGVLSTKFAVNGAGNRGQHKLVREHLSAMAAKALK